MQMLQQVVGHAPEPEEAHDVALDAAQAARAHHHQLRLQNEAADTMACGGENMQKFRCLLDCTSKCGPV